MTTSLRKRIKAHDLRICTWNVRTLYTPDAVAQLENVFSNSKADIIALQEIRGTGQACTNIRSCDVSAHVTTHINQCSAG